MGGQRQMNASDILDKLLVEAYVPPLSLIREDGRISDLANPLSVIMLIIDLETEISMNGIQGYIGNSTGRHASTTVDALRVIGCNDAAKTLAAILKKADDCGMTHDAIQRDRRDLEEFAITQFRQMHGSKWDGINDELNNKVIQIDFEQVFHQAETFIETRKNAFVTALSAVK